MNYIFLRRTEDWLNTNWSNVKPPEIWRHKPELLANEWNYMYEDSWFEFRYKLKQIAISAWKFPYISDVSLVKNIIKDDDWLIPCDDDDWFHPDLGNYLEKCDTDIVHWDVICNQSVLNYNVHAWKSCHKEPCSNSFALRGSLVKTMSVQDLNNIILHHDNLLQEVKKHSLTVQIIPEQLGVYNWHPGSISFLIFESRKRFDVSKVKIKLMKKWLWANPQLQEVQDLVQSLKIRSFKVF